MSESTPTFTLNWLSLSTAMVIAMCDEQEISRSTGFLWTYEGEDFLVTNWHSLTGVNPYSGRFLSRKLAARPNSIRVALPSSQLGRKLGYNVPLFDENGDPLWSVHPTAREQVDIAVIRLPDESERPEMGAQLLATPLNTGQWANLEPFVGENLFVIGFPRNLHMHGLPIWKRATFATEPVLFSDKPGHRQVWIDCASREGMSGSPVIQVAHGHYLRGEDRRFSNLLPGHEFYGIYSGRLVDPEDDPRLDDQLVAQIGIVWPRLLIERVVTHGVRDVFRRENSFEPTIESA